MQTESGTKCYGVQLPWWFSVTGYQETECSVWVLRSCVSLNICVHLHTSWTNRVCQFVMVGLVWEHDAQPSSRPESLFSSGCWSDIISMAAHAALPLCRCFSFCINALAQKQTDDPTGYFHTLTKAGELCVAGLPLLFIVISCCCSSRPLQRVMSLHVNPEAVKWIYWTQCIASIEKY